jgi:hypothetical protein
MVATDHDVMLNTWIIVLFLFIYFINVMDILLKMESKRS